MGEGGGGKGGGGCVFIIGNQAPWYVCKQSLSFTHDDAALVSRYTFFFPLLWEEDERPAVRIILEKSSVMSKESTSLCAPKEKERKGKD